MLVMCQQCVAAASHPDVALIGGADASLDVDSLWPLGLLCWDWTDQGGVVFAGNVADKRTHCRGEGGKDRKGRREETHSGSLGYSALHKPETGYARDFILRNVMSEVGPRHCVFGKFKHFGDIWQNGDAFLKRS